MYRDLQPYNLWNEIDKGYHCRGENSCNPPDEIKHCECLKRMKQVIEKHRDLLNQSE